MGEPSNQTSLLRRARDDAENSPSARETSAHLTVAREELLFDAVIPVVYREQPITIPLSTISEGMTTAQCLALSIERSVRATFNRSDTDPPLRIIRQTDEVVQVAGWGHAGVVLINGETAETKYFEYGRYAGNFGSVRERP